MLYMNIIRDKEIKKYSLIDVLKYSFYVEVIAFMLGVLTMVFLRYWRFFI